MAEWHTNDPREHFIDTYGVTVVVSDGRFAYMAHVELSHGYSIHLKGEGAVMDGRGDLWENDPWPEGWMWIECPPLKTTPKPLQDHVPAA